MTAKKRWLRKIYQDSQESKCSQEKISWSSSDSDEDVFNKHIYNKKKKVDIKHITKPWLKSTSGNKKYDEHDYVENAGIISDFQFPPICKNDLVSENSIPVQSPSEIHKMNEIGNIEYADIEINLMFNQNCDSPIINGLKLEEMSPVLIQNPDNIDLTNDVSPILGKRNILKKVRSNYKRKHKVKQQVFKHPNTSPDLFTTQSTQVIDCDSPDYSKNNSLSPVKPSTPVLTECIVPFPSQSGSEVNISDSSSSRGSSSLTKTDCSSLYHQPTRRKKNYKKGGLASLLQRTLHLQRTRTSIWQHEIYTNKADEVDIDKRKVIKFLIKKQWKEYGNTLLESEVLNNKHNNNISYTNINDQSFICIIVIGCSTTLNIIYKSERTYTLLPPYSKKNILYKSKPIPCYFNVTKLIMCKEEQPT